MWKCPHCEVLISDQEVRDGDGVLVHDHVREHKRCHARACLPPIRQDLIDACVAGIATMDADIPSLSTLQAEAVVRSTITTYYQRIQAQADN